VVQARSDVLVGGLVHHVAMTWIAPEVVRASAPLIATEREMLQGWLDFQRQTLRLKCAGLDLDQLRRRSAEPSSLTLLGLVRHMAEVERWWFRRARGQDLPQLFCSEEGPDDDFNGVDSADPAADFATFAEECALADAAVADLSLDATCVVPRWERDVSLRWIYVHMIEEYARHNGHADILRERIDGTVGD
jgi:hypothetical protein